MAQSLRPMTVRLPSELVKSLEELRYTRSLVEGRRVSQREVVEEGLRQQIARELVRARRLLSQPRSNRP
jgi:Arc/MetJ-type ribon-helix-helix transcriptional regulator